MKLKLFLILLSLSVTLFITEIGARLGYYLFRDIPFFFNYNSLQDPELGWVGKSTLGNPNAARPKIIFIGDSFTEGLTVAPADMYYSVTGQILNAEVFAYGGLGYGTLQELIALKRLLQQVKPDLIVLQVCSNDLVNNSWELEKKSFQQNAAMMRPYYENDQVVFRFPGFMGQTRVFLDRHSRAFHFFASKWELLLLSLSKAGYLTSVEQLIARESTRMPEVRDSITTTKTLISKIKEAAGATPVFAFTVDGVQPNGTLLKEAFKENSLILFDGIPKALKVQDKKGIGTRLPDKAHLNEVGNKIVAEEIAQEIQKRYAQFRIRT